MNSTKLISTLFKPRQAATALYATQAEAIQAKVFKRLIKDAANTEWGLEYSYKDIKSYQDYQRVPLQTYEEIKPYVERMRRGEKNVLWPGEVIWFAKSSGTTNDKSKFIPVSSDTSFTVFIGPPFHFIVNRYVTGESRCFFYFITNSIKLPPTFTNDK